MVLIDSHVASAYGGNGVIADWPTLARYPADEDFPPLVLAGGLVPANISAELSAPSKSMSMLVAMRGS